MKRVMIDFSAVVRGLAVTVIGPSGQPVDVKVGDDLYDEVRDIIAAIERLHDWMLHTGEEPDEISHAPDCEPREPSQHHEADYIDGYRQGLMDARQGVTGNKPDMSRPIR